jgi:hypothetical protein
VDGDELTTGDSGRFPPFSRLDLWPFLFFPIANATCCISYKRKQVFRSTELSGQSSLLGSSQLCDTGARFGRTHSGRSEIRIRLAVSEGRTHAYIRVLLGFLDVHHFDTIRRDNYNFSDYAKEGIYRLFARNKLVGVASPAELRDPYAQFFRNDEIANETSTTQMVRTLPDAT